MTPEKFAALERRVRQLERRKSSPFGVARSTNAPVDTGSVQTIQAQLDALTTVDAIPILYHHGFFSNPPVGSDLHLCFLDGDRSKAVIVASGNQATRFKNAGAGDAGLFAHGLTIHLASGGMTLIDTAGSEINMSNDGKITLTSEQFIWNGQNATLTATGEISLSAPIVQVSEALQVAAGPITQNGTVVVVP